MKKAVLSLATFVIIISGCSEEKKGEDQTTIENSQEQKIMQASTSDVSAEQLKSILSSYFNVKDALVKTDAKEAKSALGKLLEGVGAEFEQIKSLSKEMKEQENIEEIREGFDNLSQEVYTLVKANAESKDQKVYKQYCPMAFNNEGAFWLSDKEEIRNPYFGDRMLKCGKVEEEL